MRLVSWSLERYQGGDSNSDSANPQGDEFHGGRSSDSDTNTIRLRTWFRRRVHNMGGEPVGQSERGDCCRVHLGSLGHASDGSFYLFHKLRSVGLPSTDHMLANVRDFLLRTARGMRCAVCETTVPEAGGGVVCGRCGAIPTFLLDVKEDVYPEEIWEAEAEPVIEVTECSRMYTACQLEKVKIGGEQSAEQCSVCLEEFGVGVEARRLPCSHLFHSHCIDPWLLRSSVCPLCRFRLPSHCIWSSQPFLH